MTPSDQPRPAAPFVGPRPYNIGEKLFGRDRERLELLDLLIAERIVLLYSASGAGKTSLVQAALVPALRNEAFTVPPVARVTFEQATGLSELPANRYVFAVLLSLEEGQPKERQFPLAALARKTLPDYLDERWAETAQTGGMVLIIDQFEEILTIDPTDLEAKGEFFAQLGTALRSPYRWALLAMREEHVAGLDPYRSVIPTRLASTFRLELLNEQQARQTMQEASAQAGVVFTNAAAQKLTDDLRRVRVQRPGGSLEEQLGPTVEPTQLQVVCLRLWSKLAPDKTTIEEGDVEALGSADTALADYYTETVELLGSRERLVRDWIEDELITAEGLRNQILKEGALQSRRVDAEAISLLDERHLVREERRRGISWLELTHDRLVQPIRANNATWRNIHLTPFQRQAVLWDRQGRPDHLELRGLGLRTAERWAEEHDSDLTCSERDFLEACLRSRLRIRNRRLIPVMAVGLAILAVVSFEGYRRLLEAQPWGYWTDLKSGEPHELGGDFVAIGRSEPGFEKLFNREIHLESTFVSRWHLVVSRDLLAFDMRSLNGTTINGRFLKYSDPQDIADGDLITIAGFAPFRFSKIERSYFPFFRPPAPRYSPLSHGTWAILLDGRAGRAIPLVDGAYYLTKSENGGISLASAEVSGGMLRIARSTDSFQMDLHTLDTNDDYYFFGMFKFEDRAYYAIGIPPGVRVSEFLKNDWGEPISGTEYASKMTFCFGQRSQGTSQRMRDLETQIVQIQSNDDPRCALGPFQIVSLR
ncbi:FHA domain-containing protein [Bradyrhizobium yuanmingense]|uniref:FHA domain-containing protein n=1 Tax=Bradyrhizobium yuanmingense TaxID=108015 RepID=UPI0023B98E52|nr:FHA domain-containing protein [Bradyrhizobium yuanmingense]MDF0495331.1 FHA domain-containing protein [Bradyrhizobium yuanmingense]